MLETDEWWGWSSSGGGAWAAVLVIIMVLGSVVNIAVLVHWFTCRHLSDSPVIALPFTDLLLCTIAVPLRYLYAPPFTPIHLNDEASLEKTTNYVIPREMTEVIDDGIIHTIVTSFCLLSLHVIILISMHRLCLLIVPCCPQIFPSAQYNIVAPWIILSCSFIWTAIVIGGIWITAGDFTYDLPIMGVVGTNVEKTGCSNSTLTFLVYLSIILGICLISYVFILLILVYKTFIATNNKDNSGYGDCRDGVPMLQGRTARAICIIIIVIITISLCWVIPLCLAFYTVYTCDSRLMKVVPYSDALLLMSGLVHPFIYTEAWSTVILCCKRTSKYIKSVIYKRENNCITNPHNLNENVKWPDQDKAVNHSLLEDEIRPEIIPLEELETAV